MESASRSKVSGKPTFDDMSEQSNRMFSDTRFPSSSVNPLVAWWKINEQAGITVADFSGHANDGTLKVDNAGDLPVWDSVNGGLTFVKDVVNLPRVDFGIGASLQLTTRGTLSLWFLTNGFDPIRPYDTFINFSDFFNDLNGYWFGYHLATSAIAFELCNASTQQLAENPVDVSLGIWHHAVLLWDGANISAYFDGQIVAGFPIAQTVIPTTNLSPYPFTIGSTPVGGGHDGNVQDVRIFNVALTAAQILKIFTDGRTP